MREYVITSESVTEGHPDKVCDQISDCLLTQYLKKDKNSRVAIECMISDKLLVIAGEVTSKADIDVVEIAKNKLRDIGYSDYESGFDVENSLYLTNIKSQSPDIAMGVNRDKICAGDQGIMFGYASDETKTLLPYGVYLSQLLVKRLAEVRKKNIIKGLLPDGKSQVSVRYDDLGMVKGIDSIVIAAQHREEVSEDKLKKEILEKVIYECVDSKYLKSVKNIHINATGKFVKGGPSADAGVTGRKIIVDSYGGYARHGGGAFSGKDYSKADRSAAYMARYIAKNLVASGVCSKAEIQLSYVIGRQERQSILINTFNTENINLDRIYEIVDEVFTTDIDSIIKNLDLKSVDYGKTAAYGHFGRTDVQFPWERLDKVEQIKSLK